MKEGWKQHPLRDVLKLEYGKPLPREHRSTNGQFLAYGANGIKCRTDKLFFDRPSIIVGRKGSAGEVVLTDGPFWPLDVTYYVTHDDEKYDLKFLYHLLKLLDLPKLAQGVKPGINRNQVYDIRTAFPPIGEQKRIVAILDEAFAGIDCAIANTEKNLANARELFEIELNSMFSQKRGGWMETPLSELADFKNGLNFTKNSKGESIKIVGVKDFQRNFWIPMDDLATAQVDGELPSAYRLQSGDILTVRSNGNKQLIGRCILADQVPEKTSHSGFTIRIRLKAEILDPAFLVHQMKSGKLRSQLVESGEGANISSLNQTALSSLPILVPSRCEQTEIVAKIERLSAETASLAKIFEAKSVAILELKQSILQKAFAGQLTAEPDRELAQAGA